MSVCLSVLLRFFFAFVLALIYNEAMPILALCNQSPLYLSMSSSPLLFTEYLSVYLPTDRSTKSSRHLANYTPSFSEIEQHGDAQLLFTLPAEATRMLQSSIHMKFPALSQRGMTLIRSVRKVCFLSFSFVSLRFCGQMGNVMNDVCAELDVL